MMYAAVIDKRQEIDANGSFLMSVKRNSPEELVDVDAGRSASRHVVRVGIDAGAGAVPVDVHAGLERVLLNEANVPLVEQCVLYLGK